MAKPNRNSKGVWSITASFNYGKKKLTLGAINKEDADHFGANLNLLISYKKNFGSVPPNVERWVDSLSLTHQRQLKSLGLVDNLTPTGGYLISHLCKDFTKYRLSDKSASTITEYEKGRRNLIDCFGDVSIDSIDIKNGREFFYWLRNDQNLADNTAKQRLRYARTIFDMAVEDRRLSYNPFKARGLSVTQSAAKKDYVSSRTFEKIIDSVNDSDWKLLFTLTRCVPMRIPSEFTDLTWDDVDFEKNKILIHSPKTRHLGKHARLVPIFSRVSPLLVELHGRRGDEIYVFEGLRLITNVGKIAKDICKRANVTPWGNFWNSIRASAETDLMDRFGLRRACQWSGNSAATAMKNYALVRSEDYDDSGENNSVAIFADLKD